MAHWEYQTNTSPQASFTMTIEHTCRYEEAGFHPVNSRLITADVRGYPHPDQLEERLMSLTTCAGE